MAYFRFLGVLLILTIKCSNLLADDSRFVTREHIVVDLERQIEWLRCSVGQRWNGSECSGNIVNLSLDMVPKALEIANEQLGAGWRLPSKAELKSILCKECPSPKIDKEIFPNTDNAPYWTGDQSIFNSKFHVSVNFHTGFSFNRFSPIKELAVRLVRDR